MPFSVPLPVLESRIASREARIGIIGMGYVGLPLTLLFSEQRFQVTGFDVDTVKVKALNSGGSYIVRIPATEIVKAQDSGFRATSEYTEIGAMDAVIICVPTPLDEYHQPDLSFIEQTARAIAPHLREDQLIILESTTYPGTTEEVLVPILESATLQDCAPFARPAIAASTSPSPPSAKIPAMTRSPAAISLKSSADLSPRPPHSPLLSTVPSSTAPFRSPHRPRRR